jgi:predicted GNAT family acetyltransferase
VRRLDVEREFPLAERLWARRGRALTLEEWRQFHRDGYRYCAIVADGQIIATAAAWKYSDTAWEVAAVGTVEEHRRQGLGKAVISFITAHLLQQGRLATCHTEPDNEAMIRTAQSVGFVRR